MSAIFSSCSERLGSVFHAIDLDPRWVKKITARNAASEVSAYVDHLIEQTVHILQTQDVANLHTTPPLLEAIARNDHVANLVNEKIRFTLLSGAHVDVDTLDLLRDIFPNTTITMVFGSTMILSQAMTRHDSDDEPFIFDPRTPYVVFSVVNPDTGDEVPYGQRGQVVMNHISKGMFLPNNLERDSALRMPGPGGQVGDSLSEVQPSQPSKASLSSKVSTEMASGSPNCCASMRSAPAGPTKPATAKSLPLPPASRLSTSVSFPRCISRAPSTLSATRDRCRPNNAKPRWPKPPTLSPPG